MRSWNYSSSKEGYSVRVYEGPWWSFVPDEIANIAFQLCTKMPRWTFIPLDRNFQEIVSVGELWHLKVCSPLCSWGGEIARKNQTEYSFPVLDPDALAKLDPNFKEFYAGPED